MLMKLYWRQKVPRKKKKKEREKNYAIEIYMGLLRDVNRDKLIVSRNNSSPVSSIDFEMISMTDTNSY